MGNVWSDMKNEADREQRERLQLGNRLRRLAEAAQLFLDRLESGAPGILDAKRELNALVGAALAADQPAATEARPDMCAELCEHQPGCSRWRGLCNEPVVTLGAAGPCVLHKGHDGDHDHNIHEAETGPKVGRCGVWACEDCADEDATETAPGPACEHDFGPVFCWTCGEAPRDEPGALAFERAEAETAPQDAPQRTVYECPDGTCRVCVRCVETARYPTR